MEWTEIPAISAAFAGSLVEAVEAFTLLLAVATVRGWRSAWIGGGGALLVLALLVGIAGNSLTRLPLSVLQIGVGILLVLFGLRWLRKAVLRAAGRLALRDEETSFRRASASFGTPSGPSAAFDRIAALAAFKAVLLEGIEVVFIVTAVGAGNGRLAPAAIGAGAACLLVLAIGLALARPLAKVPENSLKYGVAVMLTAFGLFWLGEGLSIAWPGADAALFGLFGAVWGLAFAAQSVLRRDRPTA